MTIYWKTIACVVIGFAIGSFALSNSRSAGDNQGGGIAAAQAASLDTYGCGPRDRQDRCNIEALWTYRVGDVFVVEDEY